MRCVWFAPRRGRAAGGVRCYTIDAHLSMQKHTGPWHRPSWHARCSCNSVCPGSSSSRGMPSFSAAGAAAARVSWHQESDQLSPAGVHDLLPADVWAGQRANDQPACMGEASCIHLLRQSRTKERWMERCACAVHRSTRLSLHHEKTIRPASLADLLTASCRTSPLVTTAHLNSDMARWNCAPPYRRMWLFGSPSGDTAALPVVKAPAQKQ